MFNQAKLDKLRRVVLFSALAWALAGCAGDIINDVPAHQVAMSGDATEAQLITELQSEGYQDIRVTDFHPNRIDSRPELMHGFRSADDVEAQVTRVHVGWNGTAVKDGRLVDIYVTRALAH